MRILGLAVILATAGCGAENSTPLHPVRGSVLVDDHPAAGALVVFHRVGPQLLSQLSPRGYVEADGTFQLTTHSRHDGAEAGTYAVTVVWRPQKDEDDDPGPNLLPRYYADPGKSGLSAVVEPGPNELAPLRLSR